MKKNPLLIVGSSGHAKVIIDIVEKQNTYEIIGIIDSFQQIGFQVFGYTVIGNEYSLQSIKNKYRNLKIFIAIGDNATRNRITEKLFSLDSNLEFATLIHPDAIIGRNVKIGKGVVIMAGSIINSDTEIGNFSIVNTNSCVDHDCCLEEFVSVAQGVAIGGGVKIGAFTAILIGATLKQGIVIGKESVIEPGSVIIKNIDSFEVHQGNPAILVGKRTHGEKYL